MAVYRGGRVVIPLTADWGDYLGGIKTYAEHRGKKKAEFHTDPQLREDFKATIAGSWKRSIPAASRER